MTTQLNQQLLHNIPQGVVGPNYDRSELTAGIVHLGVGNFHRAHQAMYLHQLFNQGEDFDWAICGAGVKHFDAIMRKKLESQDWLTTVVELDEDSMNPVIIGSMVEFVEVNALTAVAIEGQLASSPKDSGPAEIANLIDKLSQPEIRIVSLTITEGGYFIDQKSGSFDTSASDIKKDIASPQAPCSVFGIMIEALRRRQQAGISPFTVMSCDNIPHNGDVTKNAVLTLAGIIDSSLADWIKANVSFPNSMVDCIAPAIKEPEVARVRNLTEIEDNAPVLCEPFRQWVLEDNFVNGRPALEKVGVQFVDDVTPYELMKLRILNGGHAALAYPAALLNIVHVHDAINNKLIVGYLNKLVTSEVIPSLEKPEGIELADYFEIIKQRFGNSEVKDTVGRLCQDASNRLPKFILPTISSNLQANEKVKGLALVVALWRQLIAEVRDETLSVDLGDPQQSALFNYATEAERNASAFFGLTDIFGDLGSKTRLVDEFSYWVDTIRADGVEQALRTYIDGE